MSIRSRLFALVLLATLAPVIMAGIYFVQHRKSDLAAARHELGALAGFAARDLEHEVRATVQQAHGLSRAAELISNDKEVCSAFLAEVLEAYPQFTGILTINPDGELFCDSLRTGRRLNLTDRAYFQRARTTTASVVLEPVFGRLTGIPVLQIAYPVRRPTGDLKFVLLHSLNLAKYAQAFLASSTHPGIVPVFLLLDQKGTVLVRHPEREGQKLAGSSIAETPLFRFLQQHPDEGAGEESDFEGTPHLWAVRMLPAERAAGLRIVVGASKKELVAPANRRFIYALLILAVISALVFAGAWFLAEIGIRRPIARRADLAEAKIHSAELGFQELLDALPDPMVLADPQGRIVHFNGPAERQFGYTRQELLGRPIEVLVPPSVRGRHPALRDSFFRNPGTRTMGSGLELRAVRKDGTEFFCDISLSLITTPEGPLATAAVRDVTARKQVEQALTESEERLRLIMERAPIGVIVNDADFRYTYWNPAAERIFGYSQADVLGRHPKEMVVPPDTQTVVDDLFGRFSRGESEVHEEIVVNRTKNGQLISCEWRHSALFDDRGRLLGKVSMVQDITERARAAQALRANEERLRTILERAPIGIALNDAAFRYTYWNPAAERIFGYRADEIVGKHPFETIVSEQDRAGVTANFERLRRGELEANALRHDRAKDGRTVLCEWHHTPFLDAEGHFAGKISMVLDVTERRRAAQAIEESRERLATTLRSIGDAVIATDVHGRVDNMNPVAERLTGWPLEQARGRALGEVFHIVAETTRVLSESPVQRVLREGQVVGLANHTVLIARDGTERPIADSGAPIRGADGTLLGVVLVFRDQTDERRAEAALRESEGRFRRIVENSFEGIWTLDAERRIVYANPRMAAMLRTTPEALRGRSAMEFIAPGHEAEAAGQYERRKQGQAEVYQMEFRRTDGSLGWGHISAVPMNDESGAFVGIVAMVADITEEKRAAAALRESEERYRSLVEGSAQGILIVQDGKIVFCNREIARKVANGDPAALVGRTGMDLIVPEDRERVAAFRGALMAGVAAPGSLEYRVLGSAGETISVEAYAQPIEWQGRPAIQSTLVDVTETHQLKEQLSQSQRLESIGRLAGGIAHDFNNILTVISAYIGFILDRAMDNAELREDATVVQDASRRAAGLTRQILAFSRRQILEMRIANLNDVVTGMHTMLGRVIGEDIKVQIALDPALKPVRVDASQIDQVIMNLVVNARDAMPRGGVLSIETANQFLDENYVRAHMDVAPGEYVMLAIADTGTGMDPATQKRIFEPFFTTKPQGQGTGLGLATVYGIVKQMNGSIFLYSELNKGTTFKIYFPVAQVGTAEAVQRAAAGPLIQPTETILLVEDDELVRRSAQRILSGAGYRVIVTTSPEEALAIARAGEQPFDLLFTDVVMPGMSGSELWEAIRRVRDVRVLFMSGYTDDMIVRHGVLEGEMPFLTKPFAKKSLLDKVRDVLERAR